MAKVEPAKKPKRSLFRKIVNAFIGFFAFVFVLLVIFLGFSQTKTFREYLRHKVIAIADSSLNGKLNIEQIDGTVFTSLFLRNTSLTLDHDTLFHADRIEIKTSPLQLLLKKIYFRKVLMENVNISLLQDSSGAWNFSKLSKSKESDTIKSEFDFTIQINDLQLRNINIIRQTYKNRNSNKFYRIVNSEDLRIRNLYLTAESFIDISNSDYLLDLKELSFHPKLTGFSLQELNGQFAITSKFAQAKNFNLITDSSFISINARLDSLNLFGGVSLKDFEKYPMSIDLKATPFNFNDLSSFIESTELLKGTPNVQLKAKGKFGDFSIEKLKLDYYDTHLQVVGRLQNLNEPSKLFITATIQNSDINYKDVNILLPTLKLPKFAKLNLKNVDAEFSGEPINFTSKLKGNLGDGSINAEAKLNLKARPMEYDIKFDTENLNVFPVIGINSKINSKGTLVGRGVNPIDLNSTIDFSAENSSFNGHKIDKLVVSSKAKNSEIDIILNGKSGKNIASLAGNLLYDKDTVATYNIHGHTANLNLASYLNDKKFESDLNFFFTAKGKNFDPDKMTADFTLGVDSSYFQNHEINYSSIKLGVKTDSTEKKINLSSDFVDFNIYGDFSTKDAISLLSYESGAISQAVTQKLSEMNPISVLKDTVKVEPEIQNIPEVVKKDLKFDFDFKFKDFQLIARLIGNDKLDVSGSGNGSVENSGNNFSMNTDLNLGYLVFLNKQKTVYLSDLDVSFNFIRDNRYISFDKIFGTASVTTKRYYSGSNIKDIEADMVFNQSKLLFNTSAEIDSAVTFEAEGQLNMTPGEQSISFNNLLINSNGVLWANEGSPKVLFTSDYLRFENFVMKSGPTSITLDGKIQGADFQNVKLTADKINGEILNAYLMRGETTNLSINGNLTATISGTYENPVINIDLKLQDITYGNINFGSLLGKIDYSKKIVSSDIRFLDTTLNYQEPKLWIYGTVPVDLSFESVKKRLPDKDEINLNLKSNNFNLSALGNIIPYIINQKGLLIADVQLRGTLSDPVYSGVLGIRQGWFRSLNNYLDYSFNTKLEFKNQTLSVDSLIVENAGGAKYGGTINGSGEIKLNGFDLENIDIRLNGTLSILGQRSKIVSPLLYGDLLIGTDGDWRFQLLNNRAYFTGNVLLKYTDLVFTTSDQTYNKSNQDIDIRIIEDTTKVDKELLRFQKVLTSEKNLNKSKIIESISESIFDYDLNIKVENSAKIVFILSQAVNQKLVVEADGELQLQSINGLKRAQGAFELLQGSKLEFFRTFDATGYLRFESDIYNPYLDIVATYTSEYTDPRDPTSTPQDVAVKIKIRGPLEELGKNLASNPESIGVYVGARNIQNDVRDPQYDYADAFSFILIGKFKDDLTAQDKAQVAGQTNAIGDTATSFLGSILTSFVNSAVGDLVNNITFTQSGEYTKFTLSGRIQNLRYSFGGTSELFQNFGKANIKVEYLFNPHFLIRLERKDPVLQTYGLDEKINEMGLKYRFEF